MPKHGSFDYDRRVFQGEIGNYLKDGQLEVAAEYVSRCGKFVTLVSDPDHQGGKVIISLTAMHGPPHYDVFWSVQGTWDFEQPWL
jgi:hypothetical protein